MRVKTKRQRVIAGPMSLPLIRFLEEKGYRATKISTDDSYLIFSTTNYLTSKKTVTVPRNSYLVIYPDSSLKVFSQDEFHENFRRDWLEDTHVYKEVHTQEYLAIQLMDLTWDSLMEVLIFLQGPTQSMETESLLTEYRLIRQAFEEGFLTWKDLTIRPTDYVLTDLSKENPKVVPRADFRVQYVL